MTIKTSVSKGAAYLYLETIIVMISGYAFWIIASKISNPHILGISSAVVSLANIFTIVASMGIPNGIQRFLGKSFLENNYLEAKSWTIASITLTSIGIIACAVFLYIFRDWVYQVFSLDFQMLLIAILLISFSSLVTLFRSIIISSLRTRVMPIVMLISSTIKILLAVVLVLSGFGALGLTLGFTSTHIISAAIFGVMIALMFKPFRGLSLGNLSQLKLITISSAANWIPLLITTIGTQLGTLVVFGVKGSEQAGTYFIALTIVTGITGITYSILTIALPALSAMTDGRKRFAWHAIRLSALLTIPFSNALIFVTPQIMNLLGEGYVQGALPLSLMMFSMLPTIILTGVTSLEYAYGNYRSVLAIGLATSIPRTILYFSLVPEFGGTGAALAYTIGSVGGLVVSLVISKKIGLLLFWKTLILIFLIPVVLGFAFYMVGVNYILSILANLAVSYLLLIITKNITQKDIKEILNSLPYGLSQNAYSLGRSLKRRGRRHKGESS